MIDAISTSVTSIRILRGITRKRIDAGERRKAASSGSAGFHYSASGKFLSHRQTPAAPEAIDDELSVASTLFSIARGRSRATKRQPDQRPQRAIKLPLCMSQATLLGVRKPLGYEDSIARPGKNARRPGGLLAEDTSEEG